MPDVRYLLPALTLVGLVAGVGAASSDPAIIIYSQGFRDYGGALASMIEEDGRFDAEVIVVSQPDLFRSLLYMPHVKAAVTIFNHDKDEGLGPDLTTYFEQGGGIVGLGFAGTWTTTRNASLDVFGLGANVYLTGRYNRSLGTFVHRLVVAEETDVNTGVGDISVRTQRIIMRSNRSTGELMEPEDEGMTVLYRDAAQGYPVISFTRIQELALLSAGSREMMLLTRRPTTGT